MARRISASELRSTLRQAQQKQRQAIDRYNQGVRRHNSQVKQVVNRYNQAVNAHNSRLRADRQRIKNELVKLSRQSTTTKFVGFRTSVQIVSDAYARLERRSDTQQFGPQYSGILNLSGRETANSLGVMNSLLGIRPDSEEQTEDPQDVRLANELRRISPELDDRWRGAVFSLNPHNPDAARHFCTSAREILTQILEIKAPDDQVLRILPSPELTDQGRPTRRTKIKFFLHQKGMLDESLEDFIEKDIDNIVELFTVLNDGTHGPAGRFEPFQLSSIKKRVEDGIVFLSTLVN